MRCRDCYRLLADCRCDFGPDEPNTEPLPCEASDYFTPPLDDGTCDTGEFEIAELDEDDETTWEPNQ